MIINAPPPLLPAITSYQGTMIFTIWGESSKDSLIDMYNHVYMYFILISCSASSFLPKISHLIWS